MTKSAHKRPATTVDPSDYVYHGGFDRQKFIKEVEAHAKADPIAAAYVNQGTIFNVADLLDRIGRDPEITDIRWAAYMLATATWEGRGVVMTPSAKPKGKPKRVYLGGRPVEEAGKGRLSQNNVKPYYLPVKVDKLPDGSAEITEQDGDVFKVNTSGKITSKSSRRATHGAVYGHHPAQAYVQAAGTEHAYYGRGYCQLTWWDNYAASGARIGMGLELLFDPAKALEPEVAYKVMSDGLVHGHGFANGHKLQQYFFGGHTDYVRARAMVNGTDHASDIAGIARLYEGALLASKMSSERSSEV